MSGKVLQGTYNETYSSFEVRKGLSVEAIFSWGPSVSKELICGNRDKQDIFFFFNKGKQFSLSQFSFS